MEENQTKVNEISFIKSVYPFLFESEKFETHVAAVNQARWQGLEQIEIWKSASFPEEDFLPHVALYLNPPAGEIPTARLWKMDDNVIISPKGLGNKADWMLLTHSNSIPFTFESVELVLFSFGIGFLTIQTKPLTDNINDWLDYLHFFRFIKGQKGHRKVYVKAQRRKSFDPLTQEPQFEPFFPEIAGGIANHPEGQGLLIDVIDAILQTASPKNETKPWWKEVFVSGHLIPFSVLYVDGSNEKNIFPLLYMVRKLFHSKQFIHPAPEYLLRSHPGLLPYADDQWFVFSLEGGAFLAFDAPEKVFFRENLPTHLRDQYFLLFLLTLHQRFALTRLSQEVSEHWLRGNEAERMRYFKRIRFSLMEFTARGYFIQVVQRENHHRFYRKWQEVLQVERLYQEVNDEVREMYNDLLLQHSEAEEHASRSLERMVAFFGAAIGIPTLVFTFMGINIYGHTLKTDGLTPEFAAGVALCAVGLGVLVGLMLHSVIRRGKI
jgi:hypothetical protein